MERPSRAAEIIGVAGLVLVVVAGIAGVDNPSRNLAPVLVNVLFWLGLPLAEIVFGDLYASLNPWRALARWTVSARRRPGPKWSASAFGRLPSGTWSLCGSRWCLRSGAWRRPSGGGRSDSQLALLGLAAVAGRERALRIADPFTTYNGMAGGISPLGKDESGGRKRGWPDPLTRMASPPGLAGFVAVMIGAVLWEGSPSPRGGWGQWATPQARRAWDAGVVDDVGVRVGGLYLASRLCRRQTSRPRQ